jgi:SSS family transporter
VTAPSFHWIDWAILAAYIVGSTWLGSALAGKQQTIRDFFLGGRQLPWLAVCGSIVASEISGVTFVAVPINSWKDGGSFAYLQLWLGYFVARAVIGYWFVPAFYRREIYSPYQFMGEQLGPAVDRVTTGLFFLGGFLAQGARLYLAALVLDAITDMGIPQAIVLLGAVSVVWTWIGGINTVIWTDVIQFGILFVGAVATLVAVVSAVPGGAAEVLRAAPPEKFRVFDLSTDPTIALTLWAGLIGGAIQNLASHGTDQMMAQRLFCCRDERAARKAIVGSSVAVLLAVLMLAVGVGLYAYTQHRPLSGADAAKVAERRDYLLPIFILREMPMGVKGLLFAAIFAAATATSTLAAMGQTALMSFYVPFLKKQPDDRHLLRMSRVFILAAGALLCAGALVCSTIKKDLFDISMSMPTYTYGPILGIFLLALLPTGRDARGLLWAVPIAVVLVFALDWRKLDWAPPAAIAVLSAVALSAAVLLWREPEKLALALAAAALVAWLALSPPPAKPLAWPWLYPIGAAVTFGLGWALGRKRLAAPAAVPLS